MIIIQFQKPFSFFLSAAKLIIIIVGRRRK